MPCGVCLAAAAPMLGPVAGPVAVGAAGAFAIVAPVVDRDRSRLGVALVSDMHDRQIAAREGRVRVGATAPVVKRYVDARGAPWALTSAEDGPWVATSVAYRAGRVEASTTDAAIAAIEKFQKEHDRITHASADEGASDEGTITDADSGAWKAFYFKQQSSLEPSGQSGYYASRYGALVGPSGVGTKDLTTLVNRYLDRVAEGKGTATFGFGDAAKLDDMPSPSSPIGDVLGGSVTASVVPWVVVPAAVMLTIGGIVAGPIGAVIGGAMGAFGGHAAFAATSGDRVSGYRCASCGQLDNGLSARERQNAKDLGFGFGRRHVCTSCREAHERVSGHHHGPRICTRCGQLDNGLSNREHVPHGQHDHVSGAQGFGAPNVDLHQADTSRREAWEELSLLEKHLTAAACFDCMNKHLGTAIAYLKEARTLIGGNDDDIFQMQTLYTVGTFRGDETPAELGRAFDVVYPVRKDLGARLGLGVPAQSQAA